MSLDFYSAQTNQNSPLSLKKSQHALNHRFFSQQQTNKKPPQNISENQQIKKTINAYRKLSPLPEEEKFFPSIRPRVKDAFKTHQLYTIKQKQKRQSFMAEKRIKMYKEILQTELNTKNSRQKYLKDRSGKYDKIKNISFIGLNEKLHHDNRFNMRSNSNLEKEGLQFRSSSLYFKTLDELDRTIHKVNKINFVDREGYSTLQHGNQHSSLNPQPYNSGAKFNKYNYRYFDEENQEDQEESTNFKINAMSDIYRRKRIEQMEKQRQRINKMVKMYRQYENDEALYKSKKSNI